MNILPVSANQSVNTVSVLRSLQPSSAAQQTAGVQLDQVSISPEAKRIAELARLSQSGKLSGAERYSREVAAAIAAGTIRRAYLKGVGASTGCAAPAAPRSP